MVSLDLVAMGGERTMKKRRSRTIVEKVEIVDHVDNRQEVLTQLHAEGFRVTASGPYTTKKMFPKVDPDWFILTAERKLTHERRQPSD